MKLAVLGSGVGSIDCGRIVGKQEVRAEQRVVQEG
jgi:hypothetical protein